MSLKRLWQTVAFIGLAFEASPAVSAQGICENLSKLQLPNATIVSATSIKSGTAFESFDKPKMVTTPFCRVQLVSTPTPQSHIRIEVWMPAQDWNGRFNGVGSGGLAGRIFGAFLIDALDKGYAVAATDDGHQTSIEASLHGRNYAPPKTDTLFESDERNWLSDPELVKDYGWRAAHETAVAAKAIIAAFYGRPAAHSYFVGCSKGGQEALMEAQRFPEDYDGAVAGSPAIPMTRIMSSFVWSTRAAVSLPPAKLTVLHDAVLRSCDTLDGLRDGIIEDPAACHFDPAKLKCKDGDEPDCLTAAQVEAVQAVYGGPHNPRTGEALGPGLPFGSEDTSPNPASISGGWATGYHGLLLDIFAQPFLGRAFFNRANWDPFSFDFDRDQSNLDNALGPVVNATNPDLSRFEARGGKLLILQNGSDILVPPQNSIEYFKSVVNFENKGNYDDGSLKRTQEHLRLFLIPSTVHCGGGEGVSDFNRLDVIKSWVESGMGPDRINASKHTQDGKSILSTRPLCAYPQIAKWNGKGTADDAANFDCAVEDQSHRIASPTDDRR